ncbi:MAG: hypothetical protein Q8N47_23820, partial [Bryobacterales bacterium]|nr:hypothetical protein [Bryobacterales bacterium]
AIQTPIEQQAAHGGLGDGVRLAAGQLGSFHRLGQIAIGGGARRPARASGNHHQPFQRFP